MTDTASDAAAADDANGDENTAAVLKVVRGQPTAEELAALVAVIASQAAQASGEPAAPRKVSGRTDRARYVHAPGTPSPGGWRASAFPR